MESPEIPPTVSVKEAAALLGVSHQLVYRLVDAGELESFRVRRRIRVTRRGLLTYLQGSLAGPGPEPEALVKDTPAPATERPARRARSQGGFRFVPR